MSGASRGTLYGIGVGPGNPDLLTLRAARILSSVPTLAIPKSVSDGGSLALSVVEGVLKERSTPVERVELVFPMTKDQSILAEARSNNARILEKSLSHGDVAFISLGDIFFYSTFGNLLDGLRVLIPGLKVEVIPGITSVSAATALIGTPLVQGAEGLAVVPATYEPESIETILDLHETVVLMKIHRVFPRLLEMLTRRGLLEKTVYLSEIGTSRQEIVRDIRELEGRTLPYMSLLIVRKNGLGGSV
ncbi:MAG: precorrin-2 C(20)-methyltransferase [Leptospirales bacterium]